MKEAPPRSWWKGLFGKYVISFVGLVVILLVVNGGLGSWFIFRCTTDFLVKGQSEKGKETDPQNKQIVSEDKRKNTRATRARHATPAQRREDYTLLLEQVPAIERIIHLDAEGKEQLRLTRKGLILDSGIDYSDNPRFTQTRGQPVWLSPVYFDGLDPFIAIAMRHSGRNAGSTVAEVNLKFLSNFFDPDKVGKGNEAFVVGPGGAAARRFQLCAPPGHGPRGPSAGRGHGQFQQ